MDEPQHNNFDDFKEGQIQVLGKPSAHQSGRPKWRFAAYAVAFIIVLVIAALAIMYAAMHNAATPNQSNDSNTLYQENDSTRGIWEQEKNTSEYANLLHTWFQDCDTNITRSCAVMDTTIYGIGIKLYLPMNSKAELCVGTQHVRNNNSVLMLQAADIRADNKKIVGAFVVKGKPLAWGLSKKGYCAIINDTITVGMADNSPLFEKATETGGYFFRQYALVHNNKIVEQALKTRSIRRGLCSAFGHVFVAETTTESSMHDFSEILVGIGVEEAIYLIGGESRVAWRDTNFKQRDNGAKSSQKFKNINFIRWQ